jgi:type VI secretion system protein
MTLNVILIRYPKGVTIKDTRRSFGEQGGTIGRGQENFWALEDPERYLSTRHAQVSCGGGRYFLTDLSTNGTFLNGAAEPLGKGSRIELKVGDTFSLGDYEFRVESGQPSQGSDGVVFDTGTFADDPFGPAPTPFGGGSPGMQDSVGNDVFASPAVTSGPDTLFGLTQRETDPLAALDKAGRFPINPPASSFSYSDGANQLNQSVSWPEAVPQQGGVIPEDWDTTSLGAVKPPESSAVPSAPSAKSVPPSALPVPRAAIEPQRRKPVRQAPPPVAEKRPLAEIPARAPEPSGRKSAVAPAERKPERVAKAAVDGADLALIAALGLSESGLGAERIAEINSVVGKLVRETVAGLMQILSSRSSIKNEFRMQVTTIQPIENNPLKFSATVDDALENMFVKQGKAYKEPVEAVRESFQSIAEHQLAVVAGIRCAFRGVMEYFDPVQLERRFEKRHKGAVVLGSRKAKLWDAHCEHYQSLIGDIDNSFQHLFGDEFVQAYEDQLQKLAMARNAKQRTE